MKTLVAILALVTATAVHAQTVIRYDEPDPNNIRVQELTDDEFKQLTALSDARQKALDAYFKARDAYASEKQSLQSKYNAYETKSTSCNDTSHTDVEWKGKFIIVESFPSSGYGLNACGSWGGGQIYFGTPAGTYTPSTSVPIADSTRTLQNTEFSTR